MNLSLQTQTQVVLGLFEKETHRWLNLLSRDIVTAIDIGTAHGEYAIFFLKKTNAAKIYAFEPDTAYAPIIDENLRLNGIERSDRLRLSTKLVGSFNTDQEVQLDSLAPSIHPPCLIKMDVDGAEERILQGSKTLNTMPDIRWLIETHSAELETACAGILRAAGYRTRIVRNAWWRMFLPELRHSKHNRWLVAWKELPR